MLRRIISHRLVQTAICMRTTFLTRVCVLYEMKRIVFYVYLNNLSLVGGFYCYLCAMRLVLVLVVLPALLC